MPREYTLWFQKYHSWLARSKAMHLENATVCTCSRERGWGTSPPHSDRYYSTQHPQAPLGKLLQQPQENSN